MPAAKVTHAEKEARNLAAATQYREREGHLNVPRKHKETLQLADGSTVEIGLGHQEPLRSETERPPHRTPADRAQPPGRPGPPGRIAGRDRGAAVRYGSFCPGDTRGRRRGGPGMSNGPTAPTGIITHRRETTVIVRIMGEGQAELADAHFAELNKLDDELLAEMEDGDEGFRRTPGPSWTPYAAWEPRCRTTPWSPRS